VWNVRNLRSHRKSFSCLTFLLLRFLLDICKDSSDDDYSDAGSSHTEGFAVMDVIEYELPDDSESDDVSSASSGTDVSYKSSLKTRAVRSTVSSLQLGLRLRGGSIELL
jgi:hypothetical protein